MTERKKKKKEKKKERKKKGWKKYKEESLEKRRRKFLKKKDEKGKGRKEVDDTFSSNFDTLKVDIWIGGGKKRSILVYSYLSSFDSEQRKKALIRN